jgi:hypothetical protein
VCEGRIEEALKKLNEHVFGSEYRAQVLLPVEQLLVFLQTAEYPEECAIDEEGVFDELVFEKLQIDVELGGGFECLDHRLEKEDIVFVVDSDRHLWLRAIY